MMLKTDFRDSGAGDLVDYIQRDRSQDAVETVDIRNQTGRELSEAEVDRFVEKSREFQFQRHMIVSPDPQGQYTPPEVSANTREVMNREFGQRPTTEYVYAVHRDTEFPHAHVAVTGRESELEMDRAEIKRLRERAATVYNEPERAKSATQTATDTQSRTVPDETREELHERELSMEEHPEKEVLQDRERSQETTPPRPQAEKERELNRGQERKAESEVSREAGLSSPEEPERNREPDPEAESGPEPEPERDRDWTMGDE